eukprot:m.71146 g.71146  ORF g.71146 m.71146 type:complete len:476 (+) comp35733_c0_seq1:1962-3389(+)
MGDSRLRKEKRDLVAPVDSKMPFCGVCKRRALGGTFLCGNCVSKGLFSPFFLEKKRKLSEIREDNAKMIAEILVKHKRTKERAQKLVECLACRRRIAFLQEVVELSEKDLADRRSEWKAYRKKRKSIVMNLQKIALDVSKEFPKEIVRLQSELGQKCSDLLVVNGQLGVLRKSYVDILTTEIFPLVRLTPYCNLEEEESNQSEVIASQVAEAMEELVRSKEEGMHVVKAVKAVQVQWIDIDYSICGLVLPCGERLAKDLFLSMSLAGSVEEAKATDALPRTSPLCEVASALRYAATLISLMAELLEIHLPFQVDPSQFSASSLTEISFRVLYAQMQANALFLCFPLRIPKKKLVTHHVLHNLALCKEAPPPTLANHLGYRTYPELMPEVPSDWEPIELEMERGSFSAAQGLGLGDEDWETVTSTDSDVPKEVLKEMEKTQQQTTPQVGGGAASMFMSTLSHVSNMVWGSSASRNK